jgi:lipopolysaccharide transport system permease protein
MTVKDQLNNQSPTKSPIYVLEPPKGWSAPSLREIWEYRELLMFLTWRDLKVRYKQTALGVGWAIIPPVVNMVIFSVIFGQLAKLPSEGVPYPIFSFAGLVPWGFFSKALAGAGKSLLTGAGLSAKVYFPRLVISLSAILSSLVDSAIPFLVLSGLMVWFHIIPGWGTLTLPFFLLIGVLAALGAGVWLAALSVQYRDVAQLSEILITVWMYASPVAYSPTLIPGGIWSTIYWTNPMAVVVQGFRWALIGSEFPPSRMIIMSVLGVLLLLATGLYYFQRVERTFIDFV